MRVLIALLCLSFLLPLQSAHAQTGSAVLLPARGDDRLPTQRDAAQQALSDALSAQGYRVVTHADALSRLPDGAPACEAVDCAATLLRALSLNVAAACAVWLSPDAPEGTVFVTLVDDAGARYPGAQPVHAGDLAIATRAALADARALQMLGPGPWVHIHGVPEGAKVFIDDQLAGTLPYRAAMTAGRYSLRVEAVGHVTDEQDLDLPLNAGRVVEVDVNLAAGSSDPVDRRVDVLATEIHAAPLSTETERRAQLGDYVFGGALAVAGLLLMTIDPLPTIAQAGDCVDPMCRDLATFGARTTLEVLAGAALMATGAVVTFVWKPFSVRVDTGAQTAVHISTRF